MVRICVSVPVRTTATAMETIRGLATPDLVELRLDYSEERIDLAKLRKSTNAPLVATARLPSQGGRWVGGEGERQRLLLSAAKAGFDYVDVEVDSNQVKSLVEKLHSSRTKVIVSRHILDRTSPLDELLDIHRVAKEEGADVVKIVGTASCHADNLPCLSYLTQMPGNVSFAMGLEGVPSRVFSPLMGGAWTYASAGEAVASGQLTLQSLREAYRLMGVEP
jgi:3-dehydroquinate dehydratase type I